MIFRKPQLCKRVMPVKNGIRRIPAAYHEITHYLRPLKGMSKRAPCSKVTHMKELCTPEHALGIKCHYAECQYAVSIFFIVVLNIIMVSFVMGIIVLLNVVAPKF